MRIIGAGLSKTGTTSLCAAISQLGLSSIHYDVKRLNLPVHDPCTPFDFRVYDDIDAVFDIPSAYYYRELLEAYPESKCILTIRDEDAWWRSIQSHFNERNPIASAEQHPFKWALRHLVYGSATADKDTFIQRYREHNNGVVQHVRAGRLLVMDVTQTQSWDTLCAFLGVPVPDSPFPRRNRKSQFDEASRKATQDHINELIPADQLFVLIDEYWLDDAAFNERAVPFLVRDGEDMGPPETDDDAMSGLAALSNRNVSYLVMTWPAFWWLDLYPTFHSNLRHHGKCLLEDPNVMVFSLDHQAVGRKSCD